MRTFWVFAKLRSDRQLDNEDCDPFPTLTYCINCGGTLTEACLGETDKRYDPKASNALQDQTHVYNINEGFYSCAVYFYDGMTGLPLIESNPFGATGSLFPRYTYMNQAYAGSRLYSHRLHVWKALVEGDPGYSLPSDSWSTSTHEKDGVAATWRPI
jgi:hypothetical protein